MSEPFFTIEQLDERTALISKPYQLADLLHSVGAALAGRTRSS